ncbi:hypothetical protein [Flaviaesturariibacter amylovorans]|uniref:Uncharacterized protein n=1 Tax=Flaviaesturariibacter amylovorans TaxID=1084520 RepID=A0ABP8HE82_9BACT
MDSVKPDKTLAGRLDGLELPGAPPFREEAVWNGIARHLRARRLRALWPRMAVAALLLLLAAPLLLLRTEVSPPPQARVTPETKDRISTGAAPAVEPTTKTMSREEATVATKTRVTQPAPGKVVVAPALPGDSSVAIVQVMVPADTVPAPPAAAIAATPAVAVTAPVRRFRIAHINDRGTPVLPEIAATPVPDEDRDPQGVLRLRRGASGPQTETEGPHERRPRRFSLSLSPQ